MVSVASLRRQRFSGRVVRSIAHRGKGYEECFSLLVSPDLEDDFPVLSLGREYALVDVQRFEDEPKVLPQALYERFIPSDVGVEEFVAGFFAGNRVKDALTLGGRSAVPRVVPPVDLSEEQFWAQIEVLKGSVSATAMVRLTDSLALLSEGEIVGFQDALVVKLVSLDHPDNAVRTRMNGRQVVSDDASLYYRCWVVAQGRDRFEEKIANPGARLPSVRWQTAELLLDVARKAMEAATDDDNIYWRPANELATGSNIELWGESGIPPRPIPVPTPDARQAHLARKAGYRGITDPLSDAFFNAKVSGDWYGVRMLTQVAGGYVETVVHFTVADNSDPVAVFQEYASQHSTGLGGTLAATDPIRPTNMSCDDRSLIYVIRRTSPLDQDAYLDEHFRGRVT